MKFNVTEVEFDFTDSQGSISFDDQQLIINDWSEEQMLSYVYSSLKQEIVCTRNHLPLDESLKLQIDEYDENLYEILLKD